MGWGLGWTDIAIAFVFYIVSGLGVTVGFRRYFTPVRLAGLMSRWRASSTREASRAPTP
ncbi:MAG: hypothetical protein HOW59_08515 [Nonomuraea sp.]|nr:hypothetical protein [Nonomuraea sp.]